MMLSKIKLNTLKYITRNLTTANNDFMNLDSFKNDTKLGQELKAMIKVGGPLPISKYMKLCLTHPVYGFYNKSSPIGSDGHFVTSPEISFVFGELIGIWLYTQWEKLGFPKRMNLVELGPGNGKLMKDMLSAVRCFPDLYHSIDVYMIETSEHLIRKQQYSLDAVLPKLSGNSTELSYNMRLPDSDGTNVHWVSDMYETPHLPTIIIANEFFDALPVNQFEYFDSEWRERLITLNDKGDLQYSLSSGFGNILPELLLTSSKKKDTSKSIIDQSPNFDGSLSDISKSARIREFINNAPASEVNDLKLDPKLEKKLKQYKNKLTELYHSIFLPEQTKINGKDIVDHSVIEANVDTIGYIDKISGLLDSRGGTLLMIDYGHNHIINESLRGIHNHQFVDIFHKPGETDITSDVDFSAINRLIQLLNLNNLKSYGPIPQGYFLCGLGVAKRAELLAGKMDEEQKIKDFAANLHRIVDEDQMGMTYKVMALSTLGLPTGFEGGEFYWNNKEI